MQIIAGYTPVQPLFLPELFPLPLPELFPLPLLVSLRPFSRSPILLPPGLAPALPLVPPLPGFPGSPGGSGGSGGSGGAGGSGGSGAGGAGALVLIEPVTLGSALSCTF